MNNINNVEMTANAKNPEEEMKMTNVNNIINGVTVEELNKEEKMMMELNERREMLIDAIEEELTKEIVDMVIVGDYEEILAGVEYEIIELLNVYEEQVLEEEYKMEKESELNLYVEKITPVLKEEKNKRKAIEKMIQDVEKQNLKIKEEQKMKNVKITQDEVREYKARYQESIKREVEYVDVLIGHESYHGQMEYNLIAPALATNAEKPKGLSREQASYLLEEESKKQEVIISLVSRELGLSKEAITMFMNE